MLLAAVVTPASAFAVASAELYRTESNVYGRYEARIRYAGGDGVVSAFFLWKVGSEASGAFWNEIDYEKLGASCELQTNAIYGNPATGTEQRRSMPSDMCDAYHDYRFEWTPTYIAWAIDGQEIRRDTGAVATAFANNAQAGLRFHFNVWPGNANFGGNFNPSILPVRQYVSWAQYSSFQNGTFTVAWREDFNGSSIPSGWAVGNWASPYSLSTHNPANVSFVNGIAVLSMTADGATGFNGTPPPDGAAGMGGSGGAGAGGASMGGAGSGNAGTGVGGAAAGQGGNGGTSQGGMPGAGGMSQGGAAGDAGTGVTGGAGATADAGAAGASNAGASSGGMTGGGTNGGGVSAGGAGSGAVSSGGVGGTAGTGTAGTGTAGTGTAGVMSTAGSPSTGTGGTAGGDGGSPNPPVEPGGCGCHTAGRTRSGFAVFAAALFAVAARRRRKRASP